MDDGPDELWTRAKSLAGKSLCVTIPLQSAKRSHTPTPSSSRINLPLEDNALDSNRAGGAGPGGEAPAVVAAADIEAGCVVVSRDKGTSGDHGCADDSDE